MKLALLLLLPTLALSCSGSAPPAVSPSAATETPQVMSSAPTASPTQPAATGEPPQQITLRAGDIYYSPRSFAVRTGRVIVTFINEGSEAHTFNVKNLDYRGELLNSSSIASGQTVDFEFTLSEPGTYTLFCVFYGHQNKGQNSLLTASSQ